MFFDRYEIHIQAFVHSNNGILIIFKSSSPQNYFKKYILENILEQNSKHNAQLQSRKSRNHGFLSFEPLK